MHLANSLLYFDHDPLRPVEKENTEEQSEYEKAFDALLVDAEGFLVAQSDFTEPVGPSFWERH